MVDLQMMLKARDRREQERQSRLDTGLSYVTLLMNVPGRKKSSLTIMEGFKAIYDYVYHMLRTHFTVVETQHRYYVTGPESFFVIKGHPRDLKVLMMSIENSHPLGRLVDLDVYDEGNVPMKRTDYGEAPRQCMVCDEAAKVCARNRSHSPNLILAIMECRITNYFNKSHREIVL